MTKINELKEFLNDNDIINMNVIAPMINNVADDAAEDADTFKTVSTPTASPVAGAITKTTQIALSSTTTDAIIHYTVDGSTPDETDSIYSTPFVYTIPITIKAKAYRGYQTASEILSASYTTAVVTTPVGNPVAGSVEEGTTVALTCATVGAVIYYTLNGSTPTVASAVYSTAISITQDGTVIKAIGVHANYTTSAVFSGTYNVLNVATPVADPVAGAVEDNSTVTLTCSTSEATIYYTTDGSTPDSGDTEYTTPISITDAVTIKAIGIKTNYTDSAIMSEAYTIAQVATPVANPVSSAVEDNSTVTLTCGTSGATMYYTTDGSTPDAGDTQYTVPISITDAVTIKAIGIKTNYTDSAIMSEAYTILQVATPVGDLDAGAVEDNSVLTLTCSTSGATMYYTTDGSTPDSGDTQYTTPITITDACTVKAIGIKANYTDSAIFEAAYTILQVSTPTADPAAGAIAENTPVALSCVTTGAVIHYTTDGSAPTGASTTYTTPIVVYDAVTIKAIAVKTNYTDSAVLTSAYTII